MYLFQFVYGINFSSHWSVPLSFILFLWNFLMPLDYTSLLLYYGARSFIVIIFFILLYHLCELLRDYLSDYSNVPTVTPLSFIICFICSLFLCYLYINIHIRFCQYLYFIFYNSQTILAILPHPFHMAAFLIFGYQDLFVYFLFQLCYMGYHPNHLCSSSHALQYSDRLISRMFIQ